MGEVHDAAPNGAVSSQENIIYRGKKKTRTENLRVVAVVTVRENYSSDVLSAQSFPLAPHNGPE